MTIENLFASFFGIERFESFDGSDDRELPAEEIAERFMRPFANKPDHLVVVAFDASTSTFVVADSPLDMLEALSTALARRSIHLVRMPWALWTLFVRQTKPSVTNLCDPEPVKKSLDCPVFDLGARRALLALEAILDESNDIPIV